MPTVDPSRPSAEDLASLLEFERLIADLSTRFISLPAAEVDREIEDALRRVCEFLGVDVAVLWQWSARDPGGHPAHPRPSPPGPGPFEPLRQELYPWVVEADARRPRGRPALTGRAARGRHDRPRERPLDRHQVEPHPSSRGRGRASGRRPGLQHAAGGARLARSARPVARAGRRRSSRTPWRGGDTSCGCTRARSGCPGGRLRRGRPVEPRPPHGRLLGSPSGRALSSASRRTRSSPSRASESRSTPTTGARPRRRRDVRAVGRARRRWSTGSSIPRAAVRWIDSRGRPQPGPDGRPAGSMGVSIDITERKGAEEAIRAGRDRLEAAADLAGLAFYEVDFAAGTAFLDERFRDLSGVPPEREPGLGPVEFWMEQVHPEDRERVLAAAPAAARRDAGGAQHRVPLPAPGPRREVVSPRGPRHRAATAAVARSRRSASSATSRRDGSARRPCGSRTRRSSG